MPEQRTPDVYASLAEHQKTEEWRYRDCLVELHAWAERFNFEFKLQIPQLVIGIGRLRTNCLGQFRMGHNEVGLRGEVILDERHVSANLGEDRWWDVLGTLLHELIHGWQEAHGKAGRGNYHNNQFCRKAADLGLIVDRRGVTQYDRGSPFFELLERHGVRVPTPAEPKISLTDRRRAGRSKLKLWVCDCPVRVRVAVADFEAKCLRCGSKFERVGL